MTCCNGTFLFNLADDPHKKIVDFCSGWSDLWTQEAFLKILTLLQMYGTSLIILSVIGDNSQHASRSLRHRLWNWIPIRRGGWHLAVFDPSSPPGSTSDQLLPVGHGAETRLPVSWQFPDILRERRYDARGWDGLLSSLLHTRAGLAWAGLTDSTD